MPSFVVLVAVGVVVGLTTALFGFGGGFVTVPIIAITDAGLGTHTLQVATATSLVVMLVNAAVATASTRRDVLRRLDSRTSLLVLLAVGGALGAEVSRFAPSSIVHWGFVIYLGATVVDLLARPGFLHASPRAPASGGTASGGTSHGVMRTWLGVPVGAVATFLGVGGSVMTVPLTRRSGESMPVAAALANPLTLAIVAPAAVLTLSFGETVAPGGAGFVGPVDLRAAVALLVGAMPVIVALRRRPPKVPDLVQAWGYVSLLVCAGLAVAATGA